MPADDKPFDVRQLPTYSDGDWPEWPAQEMLDWMPGDIQNEFGEITTFVFNGDLLNIDPMWEEEIVAALNKAGYTCTHEDHLVALASGI